MASSPVQELGYSGCHTQSSGRTLMPWGGLVWTVTARGRSYYPGEGEGLAITKSFWNPRSWKLPLM